MKSKMSFFNKGLIFSNIKRYSWVSAIWFVLLFLVMPLSMMTFDMTYDISHLLQRPDFNMYMIMNRFGGILANIMLCFFPVLIGMLMFRYLHSPKSATVLHGLPFSRPRLFANAVFSGIALMLIPLLLNTAIVLAVKLAMPVGKYIEYAALFTWLLNSVCMALCVFALTVFVGMFTGNMIAHIVFTYIIHFLPLLLWVTISELLSSLVYGCTYTSPPTFLTKFPMIYAVRNFISCDGTYVTAGILLLITAFFVYRKRPVESAGDIVSFRFLRPVFKYGVTFCTAICGYIFFCSVLGDGKTIVTALIFTVIGYAIAQMLISKTWRIWSFWKGLVVSILLVVAFWGGIKLDIFGFERRVPDLGSIDSVELQLPGFDVRTVEISDTSDIELVRSIHESLAGNKQYKEYYYGGDFYAPTETLELIYHMKNGTTFARSYQYILDDYKDMLKPLYSSDETRLKGFGILSKTADEIKSVFVNSYKGAYLEYTITDKSQITEFLNALKADLMSMSFEDLVAQNDFDDLFADAGFEMHSTDTLRIGSPITRTADDSSYTVDVKFYHHSIRLNHKNTVMWLEKNIFNEQ